MSPAPYANNPNLAHYSDHVRTLMYQVSELEKELGVLMCQYRQAVEDRRHYKANYAVYVGKIELLNRVKKRNEIELYWATLSGENPARIEKAEDKLRQNHRAHYEAQIHATHRLKALVAALRVEQDLATAARAQHARIVRTQEELHRRRPCEVFLCAHCRRRRHGREERALGRLARDFGFLLRNVTTGGGERGQSVWEESGPRILEEDFDCFNIHGGEGGVFARVKRALFRSRRG